MISSRKMIWAHQVACMWEVEMPTDISEETTWRPRLRWVCNIKMDFRDVRCKLRSGFVWLMIGPSCQFTGTSGSIKNRKFLN
jgi:hypothetical protein